MKRICLSLGAVLCCLTGTNASAADWMVLGTDSQGAIWSLDFEAIRESAPAVQVWVSIDYRADKSVQASEAKRLYHIDCNLRVAGVIYQTIYDQAGAVHSSVNLDDRPEAIDWRPIAPSTSVDALRAFVCP